MHADKALDLEQPLPVNAETLEQDLRARARFWTRWPWVTATCATWLSERCSWDSPIQKRSAIASACWPTAWITRT